MAERSGTRKSERNWPTVKKLLSHANGDGGMRNSPPSSRDRLEMARLRSQLLKSVQREMSSVIRDEIQRRIPREHSPDTAASMYASIVNECVENLAQLPICESLSQQIRESITERFQPMSMPHNSRQSQHSAYYMDDTVASSTNDAYDTSSMGSSNYLEVMSTEMLDDIAERLAVCDHWSSQQEALRILASFPMAEVIQSKVWNRLRLHLKELLVNEPEEAFDYGLRFHFKMLNSSTAQCVVASYNNLVESMHALVLDADASDCATRSLDPTGYRRLFRVSEPINTFQKVIPQYWNRYPEASIKIMLEHTVHYLMDITPFQFLTPLTVLALMDRKAEWFQNWLHGDNVRRLLADILATHHHVLPALMAKFISVIESQFRVSSCDDYYEYPEGTQSYSPRQIVYMGSLHVLHIFGHLLWSATGRAIFHRQLTIGSTEFLANVLRVSCATIEYVGTCNEFCLAHVIVEILGGLINRDSSWCLQDGCLLDILHGTFSDWLDGLPMEDELSACKIHLFDHVTSILLHLTSNGVGLQMILQTYRNDIVNFVEKLLLLQQDAVSYSGTTIQELKTRVVKIGCRLLATHSGIGALHRSGLLFRIAEEWEAMLKESERTPVPQETFGPQQEAHENTEQDYCCWLKELRIVGSTSLGVGALYQANLLQDIVIFTEKWISSKNTVNASLLTDGPTLLFLSQVTSACRSYSSLTLHLMPFINKIAECIWLAAEQQIIKDEPVIAPPTLDRLTSEAHSLLCNLVCVMPSCQMVKALLTTSTVRTSEKPVDTAEQLPFFVKLVMSGIQDWCTRTELACTIGLRLFSLLCTELNVWLYLENNFHFHEMLLQAQMSNIGGDSDFLIIDEHFLLRNCFLIKVSEIGGENEKRLPPTDAAEKVDFPTGYLQEFPPITSLPIPKECLISLAPLSMPPGEIEFFLKESDGSRPDKDWLIYCREVFRNCLTDHVQLRGIWFGDLLFYAVEALHRDSDIYSSHNGQRCEATYSMGSHTGCQLVISYGLRLGLLYEGIKSAHNFIKILNTIQETNTSQDLDWMTATAFLLLCGDVTKTLELVGRLSCLPRGRQLIPRVACNEEYDVWATLSHCVEVVLHGDLPLVANAVQRSGMSIGQICQPWIFQCFWNILDWEEICKYFGLCILMGADYQVYYIVAIFRHLQKDILQHVAEGDLPLFMRETRLNGFRANDHLPFIDHLESKYRGLILSSL